MKRNINLSGFVKASDIKETEKAYTEGVYSDSPLNRKMGRVGITYAAYANKINKTSSDDKKEDLEDNEENSTEANKIYNKTTTLKNANKKKVEAVGKYSGFDKTIPNWDTMKLQEKKEALISKYKKSAELEGSDKEIAESIDEIIEDALNEYVPLK